MNLVKWLRKNNRKVMAVVVVFIMIAFVLGTALRQKIKSMGNRADKVVATFDGGEVTLNARNQAETELRLLETLGVANQLLRVDPKTGRIGQRDIGSLLLCQMIFPSISQKVNLNAIVKRVVRQNQLAIADADIDNFFKESDVSPVTNWILLKNQAKKNGIVFLPSQIKQILTRQPETAKQISAMARRIGVEPDQIYAAQADFQSVDFMIAVMSSNEITTIPQIRNFISFRGETFDYEIVRFLADMFVDKVKDPAEDKIVANFEKYKAVTAGDVSDDNPFGFGYAQPDKVMLEYVLVSLDDIAKIVPEVTEEQAEQFYQKHLPELTREVPSNPDDPNSPLVQRTMKYSEVASVIKHSIKQNRTNAKAEEIINSIKETADTAFDDIDIDKASLSQLKEKAKTYASIAEIASKKFKVEIAAEKTSFVSYKQLSIQSIFGTSRITDNKRSAVNLSDFIFTVKALSDIAIYGIEPPQLYESIGMIRDNYSKKVGIVRIIDTKKSAPAKSLDQLIEVKMPLREGVDAKSHTIREKAVEDVKLAKAYDIAVSKAKDFVANVGQDWDKTIEKFNADNFADANELKLSIEKQTGRRRMSAEEILAAKSYAGDKASSKVFVKQAQLIKELMDKIYNIKQLPDIIPFKPQAAVYVVKDVNISSVNIDEYNQARANTMMFLDKIASQVGVLNYLMPENLKARMGFEMVKQQKKQVSAEDANSVDREDKKAEN